MPSEAMMSPVRAVAGFMATGDGASLAGAFAAEGVVIVENFAPFVFTGPDALARWREGFDAHLRRDGLSELVWRFGEPQDFALDAGLAYFVLPTAWSGRSHGRTFREEGGWAFVLEADGERWRIRSYAWAVTAKA